MTAAICKWRRKSIGGIIRRRHRIINRGGSAGGVEMKISGSAASKGVAASKRDQWRGDGESAM